MEYLKVNLYGETFKVKPYKTSYASNGNLAVVLIDEDGELFDTITVNLDNVFQSENKAFIDTNNCQYAEKFIEKYHLGEYDGINQGSGFCYYPLYVFNTDKLEELPE